MAEPSSKLIQFWHELKRRKVFKVIAMYAASAFIFLEAVDMIFPRWGLPDWTIDLVLYLLIVGAVITAIISWIYDYTPEGVVKTEPLVSDISKEVLSEKARKKQNISNIIIVVLIIVVGIMLYPKLFKGTSFPLTGAQRASIAVLPLKTIGDQPDLNFLASGLVESITYMLSKIGNSQQVFSVIPASEVVESITASEARQMFGASMVITGSIQMEGNTGRLILNLINTKKQQLLKSEKFDYKKENNFILQDEAIKVIMNMLGIANQNISENQDTRSGSDSYEANELYLMGKGMLSGGPETIEDFDAAINLYKLAIKKDSLFAQAYSGLAHAYITKYHYFGNTEYIDEALMYASKSMSLNNKDAGILGNYASALTEKGEYAVADSIYHLSLAMDSLDPWIYRELGYLYDIQGKFKLAEEYHRKAINLNPDSYVSHYEISMFYASYNKLEEALAEIKKALTIAPEHIMMQYGLGVILWLMDDLDESLETFTKIYAKDSTQPHILHPLGSLHFYKGEYELASKYYKKAIEFNPGNHSLYGAAGWAYYAQEDLKNATIYLNKAISLLLEEEETIINRSTIALYYGLMGMKDSSYFYLNGIVINEDPMDCGADEALSLSYVYFILGEKYKAFQYLESALKRGQGWQDVKHHYIFKDLKNDPGFQSIVARADTLKN